MTLDGIMGEGGTTPEGGAPTPPEGGTPTPPEGGADFLSTIPEEYRAKPYMQNVKSVEDIVKQLDGAQKLIGAPKVPTKDAPKEEWDKFYGSLGRPEKPEEYGQVLSEDAKEAEDSLRKLFHENGLTKAQAEKVAAGYKDILMEAAGTTEESIKAAKLAFEKTTGEIFGTDREASIGVAKKLIDQFAPDVVKEKLSTLEGDALAGVAAVLKQISDKYISADDVGKITGKSTPGAGESYEQLRAEIRKHMSDPDYLNPMSGKRAEIQAKIDAVSKKMVEVQKTKQ